MRARTYSLAAAVVGVLTLEWAGPQAAHYSEWSPPENVTSLNSSVTDIAPALSKNGLSMYLTSTRPGGLGGFDLWVAQRERVTESWGAPVNLGSAVNTDANDQGASLSRDGHYLFFVSDRPGGYGGQDIWVSWRAHVHDDFAWQPPVNLGGGVNSPASDHGPGYFENAELGVPQLYFGSSRTGGAGGDDIYLSALTRDGSFGPAALVAELSTPDVDVGPDVRADGLEIFLHSNRPGSAGPFDIWVATRQSVRDPWSAPTNLTGVNSPFADGQPAITADRTVLYFFSNRPGGSGGADIYVSTRSREKGIIRQPHAVLR